MLTVQSFAWSSAGVTRQKALLGSSAARANLARQIAAAVRDRGADGVNLDFEPIVSTYADEFTALVRSVRAELNKVAKGYQLTFDTTGWIGNYPIEAATARRRRRRRRGHGLRLPERLDATTVGSVAPLGGPTYDITDTSRAYLARLPASKVILGVPYYGRAWSTGFVAAPREEHLGHQVRRVGDGRLRHRPRSSSPTTGGAGIPSRASPGPPTGARTARLRTAASTRGASCTTTTPRRSASSTTSSTATTCAAPAIWALGYDGTRTELYAMLKAKFITDTIPPKITAVDAQQRRSFSPNGDGRLDTTTVAVTVTGHLKFGWDVAAAGQRRRRRRGPLGQRGRQGRGRSPGTARNNADAVVPDGAYRITVWTADASNNRAAVQKVVTVDRRPAGDRPRRDRRRFISPNGDGRADTTALSMHGRRGA